jgi:MFS superfamily sulfate permease-like transporter
MNSSSATLIESLLTLNLVDDLTETTGQPNRESVGLGVANTLTGLFGGMEHHTNQYRNWNHLNVFRQIKDE